MTTLFAGIEAGGTKFVCAVGSGPDDIRAQARFPTTTPSETLGNCVAFFQEQATQLGRFAALGIGSFGPVDLNPGSPTYGFVTTTPKPGWANTDLVGALQQALNIPVGFDTDVNAAALGEWRWGAGRGLNNIIYLTIGTGVGGGALVNGQLVHGLVHPEMGHILLHRDASQDPFPGHCPFHGHCFEGMAAGPALEKRWGQRAETLPLDHPAWDLEAHYIAQGVADLVCAYSPERVILGGGVMDQRQLFPKIHQETLRLLNGYVSAPAILQDIENYIVPPGLGSKAGLSGAFALAMQAR